MAILKADKLEIALNRPNSDMKFYKSSSIKNGMLNGDLDTNNSTTFLKAGNQSNTFLTQNASLRSNGLKNLHSRKASHAPAMAKLDFLNRQEEPSSRNKFSISNNFKTTKNFSPNKQKEIILALDPSVTHIAVGEEMGGLNIGEDFANMYMEASMK